MGNNVTFPATDGLILTRAEAHLLAEALATIHDIASRANAVLIDQMDRADGDPDVEPNGDELDGTAGEDDFYPHSNWRGEPGCPVSDPGGCEHDGREQEDGV